MTNYNTDNPHVKAPNVGAFFNDPVFKSGVQLFLRSAHCLVYYFYYLLVLAVCVLYWVSLGLYRSIEYVMEQLQRIDVAWNNHLFNNSSSKITIKEVGNDNA